MSFLFAFLIISMMVAVNGKPMIGKSSEDFEKDILNGGSIISYTEEEDTTNLRGNSISTEVRINYFQDNWFAKTDPTCSGEKIFVNGAKYHQCNRSGFVVDNKVIYSIYNYLATSKGYVFSTKYFNDSSCSEFWRKSTDPVYLKDSCVYFPSYDLYLKTTPVPALKTSFSSPGVFYGYYFDKNTCAAGNLDDKTGILWNVLGQCTGYTVFTKCNQKLFEYKSYVNANCTGAYTTYTGFQKDECNVGNYLNPGCLINYKCT